MDIICGNLLLVHKNVEFEKENHDRVFKYLNKQEALIGGPVSRYELVILGLNLSINHIPEF